MSSRRRVLAAGMLLFGGALLSTTPLASPKISITKTDGIEFKDGKPGPKPPQSHHKDGGFVNPWPSFRSDNGIKEVFKLVWNRKPPVVSETPKVIPPQLEEIKAFFENKIAPERKMMLTWLGHAAFLLTFPGFHVLFDPCLSERCSPLSFAGPKRITPVPCDFDALPEIDCVVISHNHYDHLDLPTIRKLVKPNTWFFVPLGNKKLLNDEGIENVIECDWWDEYEFKKADQSLKIACTPCQHFSSRSLTDRNKTLWSSWVVKHRQSGFFFAGDTGYRTVLEGDDEDTVPSCPAFKDIGAKYGPFQLSAIPIGAYLPRWFMSPIHCSPKDAVDVHLDVKSLKTIAMHWGTFVLSDEEVMGPPQDLKQELEKRGLDPNAFVCCDIGATTIV
ncbi:beta-lactamase superfamily domain-containing protein [Gorgonomyces haynaldii]|nr:beta-lactamase superfamily domain-containing protein [Gorgonomyces haynaldii]